MAQIPRRSQVRWASIFVATVTWYICQYLLGRIYCAPVRVVKAASAFSKDFTPSSGGHHFVKAVIDRMES
ncbi:hypothetical protein PG989_003318 [Apiospora arundinis]|uniref:Secreted protein n=1 Tax=Apiospora arundinis TaxID=335852 RepID=A0ABR2I1T8_9PEZI